MKLSLFSLSYIYNTTMIGEEDNDSTKSGADIVRNYRANYSF